MEPFTTDELRSAIHWMANWTSMTDHVSDVPSPLQESFSGMCHSLASDNSDDRALAADLIAVAEGRKGIDACDWEVADLIEYNIDDYLGDRLELIALELHSRGAKSRSISLSR